jgi:hypothetical protein
MTSSDGSPETIGALIAGAGVLTALPGLGRGRQVAAPEEAQRRLSTQNA